MKKSEETQQNPYKVLVIDDDPDLIKSLERVLFDNNYVVYSATSGKEASSKLYSINPDIILLDMKMPDMDGFQICQDIKKDPGFDDVPVIILIETPEPEFMIKSFDSGAVDYIVKPINTKVLLVRIETHLKLKNYQERLKEVNMIKMKFFSIMTNDIKDSLIGVKGLANFLVQDLEDSSSNSSEGIKMAKILREDSKQLYELLENLIDWASIETGQADVKPENINISEFVEKNIAVYSGNIAHKQLKVNCNCPGDITLKSDPAALKIIFLKILSNAIKYSNENGLIEINVFRKNSKCIFEVIDNGVGMDSDVVENIFKLDTPHPKTIGTADEKGTGLGLIICNSLIERLSGSISIESKKFRGVKVTFELPDL